MPENIIAEDFETIHSLTEAKKIDNSYLILVGDDGGQTYLTIPTKQVQITESEIIRLHLALDTLCWFCNENIGLEMFFEVRELNSSGGGGMGGHLYLDKLWVHKELHGIYTIIESILTVK